MGRTTEKSKLVRSSDRASNRALQQARNGISYSETHAPPATRASGVPCSLRNEVLAAMPESEYQRQPRLQRQRALDGKRPERELRSEVC